MIYLYNDGQKVELNDVIKISHHEGVVEKIIFPNTKESKDYSCQDTGGVLVRERVGEEQGLILFSSLEDEEDVELIMRA